MSARLGFRQAKIRRQLNTTISLDMQAYAQSGPSSTVASVSDLDGYTLPFNAYGPADNDEFGFDPPLGKATFPKIEQTYSPPEQGLGEWPGFERDEDLKQPQGYEIDKLITQNLPNAVNAISRFGQVTPPRTNSTDSGIGSAPPSASASPTNSAVPERRKRVTKAKEESPAAPTTSGRKRKSTRKVVANSEPLSGPEDNKRKASLEKNRLAAAKCRVNKKEKTEQLQRDSHDKAVHNAFLKDQIMHMKEQVQQMNAVLLAHANCKGCKAPDEISKHLSQLGNEFMANQMQPQMNASNYEDFEQMQMDDMSGMSHMTDSYFAAMESEHHSGMLNPPLPDFDRSAEFDVVTPMQSG